jgi:hypothetical protein
MEAGSPSGGSGKRKRASRATSPLTPASGAPELDQDAADGEEPDGRLPHGASDGSSGAEDDLSKFTPELLQVSCSRSRACLLCSMHDACCSWRQLMPPCFLMRERCRCVPPLCCQCCTASALPCATCLAPASPALAAPLRAPPAPPHRLLLPLSYQGPLAGARASSVDWRSGVRFALDPPTHPWQARRVRRPGRAFRCTF